MPTGPPALPPLPEIAVTDSNGSFLFQPLRPGYYTLSVPDASGRRWNDFSIDNEVFPGSAELLLRNSSDQELRIIVRPAHESPWFQPEEFLRRLERSAS